MDAPTLRATILEAGFAKFRQFGIRRVTMDDIARELRISKKTIYRVFPDKAALVEACIDEVMQQVIPGAEAALRANGPVVERLERLLTFLFRVPRLVTPPFIGDVRTDYPALWEKIDGRRRQAVAHMERLLEQGRESGEVWPEIHPRVAQLMLFAILEKVLIPDVFMTGEFTPADAIATLATLFSRGVLVSGEAGARTSGSGNGRRAHDPGNARRTHASGNGTRTHAPRTDGKEARR